MTPEDARRVVEVHLMRDHFGIEVGEAIPDRPPAAGQPAPAYTVHVTTRGVPGIVRVTGYGACDVCPVELAGVRYSTGRAIERPAPPLFEPAT